MRKLAFSSCLALGALDARRRVQFRRRTAVSCRAACRIWAARAWIDYGAGRRLAPVFGRPGRDPRRRERRLPGADARSRAPETDALGHEPQGARRTADAPTDPADDRRPCEQALRLRRQQTACPTPLIAENELFGARLADAVVGRRTAQYRANVLLYLKTLAERGARPFLLVNSAPLHGRRGRRLVARGREVLGHRARGLLRAPRCSTTQGPILGNRLLRTAMRARDRRLHARSASRPRSSA